MNLYVIEIKQESKRNHFYERALYLIEAKTEQKGCPDGVAPYFLLKTKRKKVTK